MKTASVLVALLVAGTVLGVTDAICGLSMPAWTFLALCVMCIFLCGFSFGVVSTRRQIDKLVDKLEKEYSRNNPET